MNAGRALLAVLLCAGVARADPAADGRALFQGGATLGAPGGFLPAAARACANCHGARGAGGGEGPLRAPAVTWDALTRARGAEPAYASAAAILRAVETGTGRGGRALSGAMPRVALSNAQALALAAYLKRVGTQEDWPPGVSRTEIRFGTLLPLEGPAAPVGRAVLAGLGEVFDAANAAGGVHGRRIRLDAGGDAEAALRRWTRTPVFALVGAVLPEDERVATWRARERVSAIAGLAVRPRASGIDRWSFDLLPPLDAQRSALAAALAACPPGIRRLALFPADGDTDADTGPPEGEGADWFADPVRFEAAMRGAGPDGCVGDALAGAAVATRATPPSWRRVTVLPVPAALLAQTNEPLGLWRALGRASARVALELLAAAGPVLHERALLEAVEDLDGFEPLAGAPLRIRRGARFAYAPETIAVEPTRTAGPRRGDVP